MIFRKEIAVKNNTYYDGLRIFKCQYYLFGKVIATTEFVK